MEEPTSVLMLIGSTRNFLHWRVGQVEITREGGHTEVLYMKTMFKYLSVGLAVGAILPATAQQSPGASATMMVDGVAYQLPTPVPSEDASGKTIWLVPDFTVQTGAFMVELSDTILNPDPSIAYGLAVTDFGAPSTFLFVFATPIVPTGFPNSTVRSSVVGGLTDMSGDGVSLTPTGPLLQVNDLIAPLTNMGVDVGLGVTFPAAIAGSFYGYGAYAEGPIAGPVPGPWTGMQITVSFDLSGGGDIAVLTGSAFIEEFIIPEPGTMMAGGVLALGIAGFVWRRRMARA